LNGALVLTLGVSLHLGLASEYNELHPHIRYTQDNYITGLYYNSEERISPYTGYRHEYGDWGFELALAGGYTVADVIPYTRITYKNYFVAPALERNNIGVVFGLEFKL